MSEPQRRRRRPAISCTLCRKRKIKCNRELPCNGCIRSKNESCTYEKYPPQRQQNTAQRPLAPLPVEDQSTFRTLPLGDDASTSGASSYHCSQSVTAVGTSSAASSSSAYSAHEIDVMKHRLRQLEEQVSRTSRPAEAPNDGVETLTSFLSGTFHLHHDKARPGQSQPMSRSVVHKRRMLGQSHWVNGVVMWFRDVFEDLEPHTPASGTSRAATTLQRCKSLARVIKARRVPQWPTFPTSELPPKPLADALVDNYLSTLETVFRVLHIPTFRKDYAALWDLDAQPDPAFLVQLKLVLALGATIHDDSFSMRPSAMRWVYEGHAWISSPEFKSRLTMQSLQTQLLLYFARDLVGVDEGSLWISVGGLLRAAMYMGLHRDPAFRPRTTTFSAEMRRRIWNSVLELVLLSSLSSGGAVQISLDDFDTMPPGNFDDEQLRQEDPTPKPRGQFTQSSVMIALRETFPIRLGILKFLNDLGSSGSYDEALRLDAQLRSSYKALRQTLFQQGSGSDNNTPPQFAVRVMDACMNRFLLALHIPFFKPGLNQPAHAFSRKVVNETSLRVIYALMRPLPPSSSPFPSSPSPSLSLSLSGPSTRQQDYTDPLARLTTCCSGFFRISTVLCCMLAMAEVKAQLLEDDSLSRAPLRADHVALMENFVAWALRNLENGETNIKGYLFARLVVSQLESIHAGLDKETATRRLVAALEDGVGASLRILEEREAEGRPAGFGDGQTGLSTPPEVMDDWVFQMGDGAFDFGSAEPMAWVFNDALPQEVAYW